MASKRTKPTAIYLCGLLMATCLPQFLSASPITDEVSSSVSTGQMAGYGYSMTMTSRDAMTDTALTFTTAIDDDASFVSVKLPEWPSGVHFISAQSLPTRLATGIDADSTTITIIFSVSQAGDYTVEPMTVVVRGQERTASFPALHIVQNPDTAIPAITLEAMDQNGLSLYMDSVQVGQEVRMVLASRFVNKIEAIHYDVPDGAIFVAQHDANEHSTADFGTNEDDDNERVPTAFLWQPLTAGQMVLPIISCDVIALNGKHCTITTNPYTVNVTECTAQKDSPLYASHLAADSSTDAALFSQKSASLFPDAFAPQQTAQALAGGEADIVARIITYKECEDLAISRAQERHSLLPWRARRERAALEKSLGLPLLPNEVSRLPLVVSIVLFIASIALSTIIIHRPCRGIAHRRKKLWLFVAITVPFLFASLAILCTIVVLSHRGVFAGKAIHTVPDEASSATYLAPGTTVRITDSALPYLYVESMMGSGWALAEDVIVIR